MADQHEHSDDLARREVLREAIRADATDLAVYALFLKEMAG